MKKVVSLLLALCLLAGCLPMVASAESATSITFGNTVSGSITSNTDKNFYKFSILESGCVAFHFNGSMQSIVLNLFDQNNQLLWSNSYTWNSTSQRIIAERDFDLISGTYYFCIAGYISPIGGTYSSTGAYTLKTSYDSSNETFRESNETNDNKIETSNPISLGERYYGQIAFTEEKDFFKFTIADPQTINVIFNGTIEYINLYVFDESFHQIWEGFGYANSNSQKVVIDENINLDIGTYYLCAQKAMHVQIGDRTGNYSFSLNGDPVDVSEISISLNRNALTLTEEETETLVATVVPASANDKSVSWSSSDTAVATVTNGGKVTAVSAGTATITAKTTSGATAKCVVTVVASDKPIVGNFVDVFEGEYYSDAVVWAVDKNITSGTDKTHFSPNVSCTRAQAVTFLWRAAGEPEPAGTAAGFKDVKAGSYYEKAVQWAVEQNITGGTGNGKFSPETACSRAQIVTFLWRKEGSPETSGSAFSDVKTGEYYETAVKWAVANEITGGTGNGKFSPDARCARGQIVTFLYRYAN